MPYTDYNWEVIAHDYHSPLLRNHLWVHSFFRQADLLHIPRAVLGIVSKKNTIEYITDLTTWVAAHEALKKKIERDYHFLEKLVAETDKAGNEMNQWTERNIMDKDVKNFSDNELINAVKIFIPLQETVYAYGTALPLLDFAGFAFVENSLKKILERLPDDRRNYYFKIFTEPIRNSFAQDQEEGLLKLMSAFYSTPGWRKSILTTPLATLRTEYPEFYETLLVHTSEYAWVYYVYMGPAFTAQQFLEFIKDYLHKNVDPHQRLEELKSAREALLKEREALISSLNPSPFERAIIDQASLIVWAKPRRKDYQSKSYYHIEKVQREIAHRLALSLGQVRNAPIEVLQSAFETGEVDQELINEVDRFHVCLPNDDGSVALLYNEAAQKFSAQLRRSEDEADYGTVHEVTGTCAQPGSVKGMVKIVNVPEDMSKMHYGDILVSTATTPSIVAAMKRAAAIVTDEGGLTCHASIVSRELGTPCVVGAKIATKAFNDGDMVEVDATQGIVKKIL